MPSKNKENKPCEHTMTTGAVGSPTQFCLECREEIPNDGWMADKGTLNALEYGILASHRIKWYREKLGLTQKELADRLLLKQPAIARYENNYGSFTLATLCQLAVALEISLEDLIMPKATFSTLVKRATKTFTWNLK